jgi:hypothetical protein
MIKGPPPKFHGTRDNLGVVGGELMEDSDGLGAAFAADSRVAGCCPSFVVSV